MAKVSKRYAEAAKLVDRSKTYSIEEAVKLAKETSKTKFDASVEVSFRLNVDPRHADQQIRGAMVLPNGTGKTQRVCVVAQGEKEKEAQAAGADFVGGADIIEKISKGWFDFDVLVATPDMMGQLGRLGRVLGPKGLMPNPKTGTVTMDVAKAIDEIKKGKVTYRVDKEGNINLAIGKTSFTEEALEILRQKKKGNYNVVQIDPDYVPEEIEHKQVFGITFQQGRNNCVINEEMFKDVVSKNKDIPEHALHDLILSMITLKYTQSNSVCYVKNGQAIGIGAGQQSRIHCTRLAGNKADVWFLRQHPKVLGLQFADGLKRAEKDNTIDAYVSDDYEDVLGEDVWQNYFKVKPEVFTREEKKEWLKKNTDVVLGSDAFFPFGDNIERAHKSGVKYVGEPGGSIRDDHVIDTCDKYDMVLAFTHQRLFHH